MGHSSIKIPSFIEENISLKQKTYTKMGGCCRYYSIPLNALEVQQTLEFCRINRLPCAILGAGSNSVYSDEMFHGVVLSLEKFTKCYWQSKEILYVEAGVTNTQIAEICAQNNRAGASWMYRMPGQLGGTLRMNARCYGGEISQIAKEIFTITKEGKYLTYAGQDVFYGYKKTLFMDSPHVILGAHLFFPQEEESQKLLKHMKECEADRHKKNHFYLPSCGSTFKNNYEVGKPSGQIFDELGLKGTQIGQSAISEFHGNFIWNLGDAKTLDMLTLCAFMRQKALDEAHANLELEVQPVGIFPPKIYEQCAMDKLGPAYEAHEKNKWVGLFYHPNSQENKVQKYPTPIFSSPFFEYHHKLSSEGNKIHVSLSQIISLKEAKKNPSAPFLKWETSYEGDVNDLFPLKVPSNSDVKELWNYSVSEIFIANSDDTNHYLEFEITPNKEQIALKFSNVRIRSNDEFKPNLILFSENKQFGIIFTYENIEWAIGKNHAINIQCALSLGNQKYFLAPAWQVPQNEKPDFHQPNRYWKIMLDH